MFFGWTRAFVVAQINLNWYEVIGGLNVIIVIFILSFYLFSNNYILLLPVPLAGVPFVFIKQICSLITQYEWNTSKLRVCDRSIHSTEEKGGIDQDDQGSEWNISLQCLGEGIYYAANLFN